APPEACSRRRAGPRAGPAAARLPAPAGPGGRPRPRAAPAGGLRRWPTVSRVLVQERVASRVAAAPDDLQAAEVVRPTPDVRIGRPAGQAVMGEADDGAGAVGDQVDLDGRGSRRHGFVALPAPCEYRPSGRVDLDVLADGDV